MVNNRTGSMILRVTLFLFSISCHAQVSAIVAANNKGIIESPAQDYTFTRLSIKYNNTDHTYLTDESARWTDAGVGTMSNVISVTTTASNLTNLSALNACTGTLYFEKEGPPSEDEVGVKTIYPQFISFYTVPQFTTTTTIPTPVRTVAANVTGGQGITFDPTTQYIYEDLNSSVKVMNLAGSTIQTYTRTNFAAIGSWDWASGNYFLSRDTDQPITRYAKSGSTFALQSTYWFVGNEGNSFDKLTNKLVAQTGTATGQAGGIRFQDLTGFRTLLYPTPLIASECEGLVVDPRDGTLWKSTDDYYHGTIDNGNRTIHFDPRGVYGKWLHFPDLVRYSKWKLTSNLSGQFGNQTITGHDWDISPVIDYKSFTGGQSLGNYYYEGAELEFRGSGTAPTTTGVDYINLTVYDANGTNDGWGATSPGAWQSTPTTDRYMQIRLKPIEYVAPAPVWTPADLTTKILWADMAGRPDTLGLTTYDQYVDLSNSTSAGIYRSPLLINKFATDNNFVSTVNINRPRFVLASNYTQFVGANTLYYQLNDVTDITSLAECDVHVYARKPTANSTALIFSIHNTANSNNRMTLAWLPGNHATCANCIAFVENDGSAAVSLVGVANSSVDWTYITFRLGVTGQVNKIFVNGVEQTLTTVSGSNTGHGFDEIASVNAVRIARIQGGTTTPFASANGTQDMKSILFTTPAETNFSNISTYFSGL
jgi:hypothetical protein